MTDTERIDFLQDNDGCALVSDDFGNWAVACDGSQNCPTETPNDIATTFFIEKADWYPSIREAIDAFKENQ